MIDYRTRQIRLMEESTPEYVALSYVWGQEKENLDTLWVLPERLPLTIEDSIQAVLALGYKHLWVNRYCVPQEDGPKKMELIGNMGLVYETAILTLIAAAGGSPEYGLLGVTQIRRHLQISFKLGSQNAFSSICMQMEKASRIRSGIHAGGHIKRPCYGDASLYSLTLE